MTSIRAWIASDKDNLFSIKILFALLRRPSSRLLKKYKPPIFCKPGSDIDSINSSQLKIHSDRFSRNILIDKPVENPIGLPAHLKFFPRETHSWASAPSPPMMCAYMESQSEWSSDTPQVHLRAPVRRHPICIQNITTYLEQTLCYVTRTLVSNRDSVPK